jgi:NADH:ubiquinone oxidoreductase subunit 6 (subunit J)
VGVFNIFIYMHKGVQFENIKKKKISKTSKPVLKLLLLLLLLLMMMMMMMMMMMICNGFEPLQSRCT